MSKKERWWAELKNLIAGRKAMTMGCHFNRKHDSPLVQLSILLKKNDLVLKMMNEGG